jgi:hypothetical protein
MEKPIQGRQVKTAEKAGLLLINKHMTLFLYRSGKVDSFSTAC